MALIDAEPIGRVASLLGSRSRHPGAMWCFHGRPLTDDQKSAVAEAMSCVAIELEHAMEEGRQDALLADLKPLSLVKVRA